MTVADVIPEKVHVYTGPGDYQFDFRVFEQSDLLLDHFDEAGDITPLVENQDFTATVAILPNVGGTCHVTYSATTGNLRIRRSLPLTQDTDWVNNDPFNAEQLETDLDRIIMILQQQEVVVGGDAVLGPPTLGTITLPYPSAGKALKWDATETTLINSTYDVDTVGQQAQDAAQRAEDAANEAEYYANITASKVDVMPVGTILAWLPGYFSTSANEGYVDVLASNPTEAIAYLASTSFRLCNGDQINDPDSPIFNGAGRYLPKLDDNRFLAGSNDVGGEGGVNKNAFISAHTHSIAGHVLTTGEMPSHGHNLSQGGLVYTNFQTIGYTVGVDTQGYALFAKNVTANPTGGSGEHTHGGGFTGEATGSIQTDNRPLYLNSWYIMKIKFEELPEEYEYYTVLRST